MGLFDAVANIASSAYGNRMQMKAQHQAYDVTQMMRANSYQTAVGDMKAAGLNPMLAYGQGGASANTAQAASQQGPGDVAGAYRQGQIASATESNINSDTEKKNQDTATSQAVEENTRTDTWVKQGLPQQMAAQTNAILKNTELTETAIQNNKQTLKNLTQQLNNLKADEKNTTKETELKSQQIAVQKQQEILIGHQATSKAQEILITDPKVKAAQRWSGQARPAVQDLWDMINPFSRMLNRQ